MPDTLYNWTDTSLAELPQTRGFRQRGMEMTRLETFTDAAFAFAVTLLVISVDDVPRSYEEFINALKQIPVFIACFIQLMVFWWGHHRWSRRYGLEDGWSMLGSLTLVAAVLIYIYPLRVIFGAFFADASDGFIPIPFELELVEVGTLFVVFGAGFSSLAGLVVVLYVIALIRRETLALDRREVFQTQAAVIGWSLVTLTGLVSLILAATLPAELSPNSAYAYWSLIITMPAYSWYARHQSARLQNRNFSRDVQPS